MITYYSGASIWRSAKGLGKCVLYKRGGGVSYIGFFSIHFTITGVKNNDRYTGVFVISGFHCKMSLRKCPKFSKCWPFLIGTERRVNQGFNQYQTAKATCQVTEVSPLSRELSSAQSSSFHYQMTKYFNNHVSKTLRQAWRRNMLQYCELLLSYLHWKVY